MNSLALGAIVMIGLAACSSTTRVNFDPTSDNEDVACTVSEECDSIQRATCHDVVCYLGVCADVVSKLATSCGNGMVCDGQGDCADIMPASAPACFEAVLAQSTCPLCDDLNPVTEDVCTTSPEPACSHFTLPDGSECGPGYAVQNNNCCPL